VQKIKLEFLGLTASGSAQSSNYALVLGEETGYRRLPIIIGFHEAQGIAMVVEKMSPMRPMTHDLFKSFAEFFDFTVEEVIIHDLKEGVFFAKIICSDDLRKVEIDARPSDAIAIALRFGAEIFTTEKLLSEVGIVFSEFMDEEDILEEKLPAPVSGKKDKDWLKDLNSDQLRVMLEEALNAEDYEKAAQIRDELNKRN
jgi:bifunctional DNase/RNase